MKKTYEEADRKQRGLRSDSVAFHPVGTVQTYSWYRTYQPVGTLWTNSSIYIDYTETTKYLSSHSDDEDDVNSAPTDRQ